MTCSVEHAVRLYADDAAALERAVDAFHAVLERYLYPTRDVVPWEELDHLALFRSLATLAGVEIGYRWHRRDPKRGVVVGAVVITGDAHAVSFNQDAYTEHRSGRHVRHELVYDCIYTYSSAEYIIGTPDRHRPRAVAPSERSLRIELRRAAVPPREATPGVQRGSARSSPGGAEKPSESSDYWPLGWGDPSKYTSSVYATQFGT